MEGDTDLALHREAVAGTRVTWKAFEGTYLTGEQLRAIVAYDDAPRDARLRLVRENPELPRLLCHLSASLKQPEHVKYVLLLLEELCEDPGQVTALLGLTNKHPNFPIGCLAVHLDIDDFYAQYLAAQLAGALLAAEREDSPRDAESDGLLSWSQATLRKHPRGSRAAIKCLQSVLQRDALRVRFSRGNGLSVLANVLNEQYKAVMEAKREASEKQSQAGRDLQLVYETLFCLWLLSFNADVAANDFTGTTVILNTVRLLQEVDKEKIRRVGLAMLRNLSGKALYDEAMIQAGFWKVVQQFAAKRWADEDISSDVQFLLERMEAKMTDMTTFDRYKQELLTGQLEWSPAHRSERFWKDNIVRFNEKNFELVGVLAALLRSNEPQTVAIACFDLGEFSRFHPLGKKIVHEHNIKNAIMALIDSQELQIQQHALLALQKLMVANWEHLSKKSEH